MRGLAWLLPFVAACSFDGGSASTSHPGDATEDSRVVVVDSGSGSAGGSDAGSANVCVDANHDGACDSQTWLCGTKPSSPSDPMSLGGFSNVASASVGGDGKFLVAVAGATITLGYGYGIDVHCASGTSCHAQIELGLVEGGRQGCLFDGTVQSDQFQGQLGRSVTFMVPAASGVYDVRANIGMNASCMAGATTWYGSAPGPGNTIAYLCVP